jgi:hypothetical protein
MVNSDCYLAMLRNNFIPQHIATGLLINTQWFMQEAARPQTLNVGLHFLYETFGPSDFSSFSWMP